MISNTELSKRLKSWHNSRVLWFTGEGRTEGTYDGATASDLLLLASKRISSMERKINKLAKKPPKREVHIVLHKGTK